MITLARGRVVVIVGVVRKQRGRRQLPSEVVEQALMDIFSGRSLSLPPSYPSHSLTVALYRPDDRMLSLADASPEPEFVIIEITEYILSKLSSGGSLQCIRLLRLIHDNLSLAASLALHQPPISLHYAFPYFS